jgi:hypothetical protein
LALLAPVVSLLCVPVDLPRGCFGGVLGSLRSNPLRNYLAYLLPHDTCALFPQVCADDGYLSAPSFVAGTDLRHLLVDAGVDLMVFAIAMSGVCLLAASWTLICLARARRVSLVPAWTLFTTTLLGFSSSVLWARILVASSRPS